MRKEKEVGMYRDKRKKEGNRVISVYKRNDDRWCVEMLLNGKRKYEYRSTEISAEKRANFWRAKFGDPIKPLPAAPKKTPSGVARYWENQLRRVSELLLEDPDNKGLLMAAGMMSKLATAALKTVGHIEGPSEDEDDLSGGDPSLDVNRMTTEELEELLAREEKCGNGEDEVSESGGEGEAHCCSSGEDGGDSP